MGRIYQKRILETVGGKEIFLPGDTQIKGDVPPYSSIILPQGRLRIDGKVGECVTIVVDDGDLEIAGPIGERSDITVSLGGLTADAGIGYGVKIYAMKEIMAGVIAAKAEVTSMQAGITAGFVAMNLRLQAQGDIRSVCIRKGPDSEIRTQGTIINLEKFEESAVFVCNYSSDRETVRRDLMIKLKISSPPIKFVSSLFVLNRMFSLET
jgi:hypothetical protein